MNWMIAETTMQQWGLTERQREVARLYTVGLLIAQIANGMFLEEQTVKHHITAVYRKAGIAPGRGPHRKIQLIRMMHGLPASVPMNGAHP